MQVLNMVAVGELADLLNMAFDLWRKSKRNTVLARFR